MATYTPNLDLKKPSGSDYVLVSDFNTNADTLDAAVGDLADLQTTEKGSLVGAINEANENATASISVGTVTTGAPGTNAIITNTGTSADAVFNFTIPRGDAGVSGTITTGTDTDFTGILKGAAGKVAQASAGTDYLAPVSGATDGHFASLNASGVVGDSGSKAADFAVTGRGLPAGGTTGQALVKSNATNYATGWATVVKPADIKSGAALEIQHGTVSFTAAASTSTQYTLTFPTAFSGVPDVVCNLLTSAPNSRVATVLTRTATQATLVAYNNITEATVNVTWIAMY